MHLVNDCLLCLLVESLEADEAISPLGPLANIPSEVVLTYANVISR